VTFYQLLVIPLLLGVALLVFVQMLRRQMSRWHSLLWLGLLLTGAFLTAFPDVTFIVARWLGIGRGSDLVFYLAIIGGLLAFFYFHRRQRALEIRITGLVRQRALDKPEKGVSG
jgi:hypothetical protein